VTSAKDNARWLSETAVDVVAGAWVNRVPDHDNVTVEAARQRSKRDLDRASGARNLFLVNDQRLGVTPATSKMTVTLSKYSCTGIRLLFGGSR
jgi:hypothetical protein